MSSQYDISLFDIILRRLFVFKLFKQAKYIYIYIYIYDQKQEIKVIIINTL